MSDIVYRPFDKQRQFHLARKYRERFAAAGKRGGKTECGAVESIIFTEQQIGFRDNGIDPYLGVIIAPTESMLRRLSLKKFFAYAKPFEYDYHQSFNEITWHNGSIIYAISAEKPQRLEGLKANWIWCDEAMQVKEQIYLESKARLSDNQGSMWLTGSLGVQYTNPKAHWAYKNIVANPNRNQWHLEWTTADNPYFPQDELIELRESLDPRTFRQMFEIDWNISGTAMVYDQLDERNLIKNFKLDPNIHEVYVAIDWGFAHDMACLFIAYDKIHDVVYLFDEIVSKRMTIEQLYTRIMAKGYPITDWVCDIAGDQTREQTGISNIEWFSKPPRFIKFKRRRTAIGYGIPIVRSYIRNGLGQVKFYIDEAKCPRSLDQIRNYAYPERDGMILNENPVKVDDDCCDALRYYFCAILDERMKNRTAKITKYI